MCAVGVNVYGTIPTMFIIAILTNSVHINGTYFLAPIFSFTRFSISVCAFSTTACHLPGTTLPPSIFNLYIAIYTNNPYTKYTVEFVIDKSTPSHPNPTISFISNCSNGDVAPPCSPSAFFTPTSSFPISQIFLIPFCPLLRIHPKEGFSYPLLLRSFSLFPLFGPTRLASSPFSFGHSPLDIPIWDIAILGYWARHPFVRMYAGVFLFFGHTYISYWFIGPMPRHPFVRVFVGGLLLFFIIVVSGLLVLVLLPFFSFSHTTYLCYYL